MGRSSRHGLETRKSPISSEQKGTIGPKKASSETKNSIWEVITNVCCYLQERKKYINNIFQTQNDTIGNITNQLINTSINITFNPMLSIMALYFAALSVHGTEMRPESTFPVVKTVLCQFLRYYTGASSENRLPQQLSFREGSGAVDEMRSESARARSFGASVSDQEARSIASAGLFLTSDGRLRCAFCQGFLESGSLADGESAMRAHSSRFPTCPFVLGMEVGNKTDLDDEDDSRKLPTQCSETASSEASTELRTEPRTDAEWRSLAMSNGEVTESHGDEVQRERLSESELLAWASQLSLPPLETLRAAAEPRAVQGLELLEREASRLPIQHPSFINQSDRLRTLDNIELAEPADQVASAGFFLEASGMLRTLVCFTCNLRLPAVGVHLLGNAWTSHAVWSPRCGHLLSIRSAAYVRRARQFVMPDVVARFVEFASSSQLQHQQQASVKSTFPPNSGIRYRVEAREFRSRSDIPSARLAIRLGFSSAEVRVAMELRLVSVGDDFATSEQLLEAVVNQHDMLTFRSEDIESFRESELQRMRSSSAFGEPEESPETDWRTCKVCMVHRINIVLLECGHLCCCSRCSASLQTCPICRRVIKAEAPVKFD